MAKKLTDRKVAKKSDRKPETGNRFTELQKDAARTLRRTGWKQTDIADVFGTTERSVRDWTRGVVPEDSDEPTSTADRIDGLTKQILRLVEKRVTELEAKEANVDELSAIVQVLEKLHRAKLDRPDPQPAVDTRPIAQRPSVFDKYRETGKSK